MTTLALSFNDVNFSPVQQDGQIWLTATELAKALGYAKSDAVTQVYERNQDEFNSSMTTTITVKSDDSIETLKLRVSKKSKNLTKTIRIFSLRGAHLIAMFSKTAIAKQFRKWVLDILDREVLNTQIESRQTISPEQKDTLHKIIDHKVDGNQGLRAQVWTRHNRHFKINSYHELLAIHFEDSVKYLLEMQIKAKTSNSTKPSVVEVDAQYLQSVQGLAWHMIWLRDWWKEFGDSIRKLSPNMAGAVHDHFGDGAMFAYHFINKAELKQQREKIEYFNWHLSCRERLAIEYRSK